MVILKLTGYNAHRAAHDMGMIGKSCIHSGTLCMCKSPCDGAPDAENRAYILFQVSFHLFFFFWKLESADFITFWLLCQVYPSNKGGRGCFRWEADGSKSCWLKICSSFKGGERATEKMNHFFFFERVSVLLRKKKRRVGQKWKAYVKCKGKSFLPPPFPLQHTLRYWLSPN